MADVVSEQSLDWALTHLSNFGDTDLLPTPFEFEAIKAHWTAVKRYLRGIELSDFTARASRRYLVPKPGGGFRIAVQLDPLDSVLYTALVHESANLIEAARIPKGRNIALSYRINPTPDGWFLL